MLGSTHILVGATVATYSGSYLFGGLAAFLSHMVIDAIPHFDFSPLNLQMPWRIIVLQSLPPILETLGGCLILYLCFLANPDLKAGLLIVGGFMGLFIDLWHRVPLWRTFTRRITPTFFKIHEDVQTEDLLPVFAGRMMNLPLILFAIWFLLSF